MAINLQGNSANARSGKVYNTETGNNDALTNREIIQNVESNRCSAVLIRHIRIDLRGSSSGNSHTWNTCLPVGDREMNPYVASSQDRCILGSRRDRQGGHHTLRIRSTAYQIGIAHNCGRPAWHDLKTTNTPQVIDFVCLHIGVIAVRDHKEGVGTKLNILWNRKRLVSHITGPVGQGRFAYNPDKKTIIAIKLVVS